MRIAVFGAGGAGGYFGGRLAQAGEDVVFIARGEHLQAMQRQGLRVESILGDFTLPTVLATHDPRQVGRVDAILVGVKAWQVPEAARAMTPMVGTDTCVIPLENGVEAPDLLAAVLGAEAVLGGTCRISAFIVSPGQIRHAGLEPTIAFGELDNHLSPRVEGLRQAFERAGVKVTVPGNIQAAMWDKFAFIAPFSGVGALTRAPAGLFRRLPGTRQMLVDAIHEVIVVGRACRIPLADDLADKTMKLIDELAGGVTASMQRDIVAGKPSELEAQNGAVVRLGQEKGIPTPVNALIYYSLLPQELRARGQEVF